MRKLRRVGLILLAWSVGFALLGEVAIRAIGYFMSREVVAVEREGRGVVYCIGDSFTYGQGVRREDAWPQVLARKLEAAMPGRAPEVRTVAYPGDSSSVAVAAVAKALESKDARLLLVLTGWNANDGDFAAHAEERRQPLSWRARLGLWLQRSRLYRVLEQALTLRSRTQVFEDVKVIPQTTDMSLYDFRSYQEIAQKNLRQIASLCRAADVPCVLLTYPHQKLPANPYSRTEYYHTVFGRTPIRDADYLVGDRRSGEIAIDAVIREVAETEGLPWIDLQAAFAEGEPRGLFLADLHHPTAAGHAKMADAVFARLREGLVSGAPASPAAGASR